MGHIEAEELVVDGSIPTLSPKALYISKIILTKMIYY